MLGHHQPTSLFALFGLIIYVSFKSYGHLETVEQVHLTTLFLELLTSNTQSNPIRLAQMMRLAGRFFYFQNKGSKWVLHTSIPD